MRRFLFHCCHLSFAAWRYVHDNACVFSCSTAVIVNNQSFLFISSNNKQWGGSNKQINVMYLNEQRNHGVLILLDTQAFCLVGVQ
jgi:hypothetical protein